MNRLLLKIALIAAGGSLLLSSSTFSQLIPPAQKAEHVAITQGPTLEFAREDLAIVRWTTNNPGGDPDHFAIAHYGTNPKELNLTAKNHIRLNQAHPETMFRVRIDGLTPRTTYILHGDLDGERWKERSGDESGRTLHHTRPRRAFRGLSTTCPAAEVTATGAPSEQPSVGASLRLSMPSMLGSIRPGRGLLQLQISEEYDAALAGGIAPRSDRFIGSENHRVTAHPNGAVSRVITTVHIPGRAPWQRR